MPEPESKPEKLETNKAIVDDPPAMEGETLNPHNISPDTETSSVDALNGHNPYTFETPTNLTNGAHTKAYVDSFSAPNSSQSSTEVTSSPKPCVCPNFATKTADHTQKPESSSYLDTDEGQAHIRICIPSCPYRKLEADKDEEARTLDQLLRLGL